MQRAEPPGEAHRAPQFRRRTAGVRPGSEIGVAQAREYSPAVVPAARRGDGEAGEGVGDDGVAPVDEGEPAGRRVEDLTVVQVGVVQGVGDAQRVEFRAPVRQAGAQAQFPQRGPLPARRRGVVEPVEDAGQRGGGARRGRRGAPGLRRAAPGVLHGRGLAREFLPRARSDRLPCEDVPEERSAVGQQRPAPAGVHRQRFEYVPGDPPGQCRGQAAFEGAGRRVRLEPDRAVFLHVQPQQDPPRPRPHPPPPRRPQAVGGEPGPHPGERPRRAGPVPPRG